MVGNVVENSKPSFQEWRHRSVKPALSPIAAHDHCYGGAARTKDYHVFAAGPPEFAFLL